VALVARVDPALCCGHGICEAIAPEAFRLEDDLAAVIGDAPDELLREAAEACPALAIVLVDAETGKTVSGR
jgi:ferredoxin